MSHQLPNENTGKVTDQYPEWFLKYLQADIDMRDAQKAYYQQPTDYKLRVAKMKEKVVDDFHDKAIKAGLAIHREKPVNLQPTLL